MVPSQSLSDPLSGHQQNADESHRGTSLRPWSSRDPFSTRPDEGYMVVKGLIPMQVDFGSTKFIEGIIATRPRI
jgi:hypothetical protein